jgi:NitT/TauT family transport system substrate-binding protein
VFVWGSDPGRIAREAKVNTRRFSAVPLIAAVITILVAGCASAGGNAAIIPAPAAPEEPDITVAALPAVDLASLYIAQDEGLFARQGLHVTIEKIASSQAIITDQLKGQVDISAGSYVPYISAQAGGARFHILAEASTLGPASRALVVNANSPITTVGQLAGKKIGVNGTNSIGTLLVSALLAEHGVSPEKVRFITDPAGFPGMPRELRDGAWAAAFLSEPYITVAAEQYGEQVLADLDQGALTNFPIDGYVATRAWTEKYPKTAAAFVRAIEEGQTLADTDAAAVRAAIGKYDDLPLIVTAGIVPSRYPIGPVNQTRIQRVATAMLQFGMLGQDDAAEVEQGTLVGSMVSPAS